ncbi:MAG: ABC transporter permease [Patescibacteria group bacterium]|jgi:putative ABC transport system permease protein
MKLQDLITASVDSIRRNTTRSLLTVLGIVIGIAAVILMLSIGQGAQGYVLNQVAGLGSDQIFISAGSSDKAEGPPSAFIEQTLTLDDVKILRRRGDFDFVSATLITNASVTTGDQSQFIDIAGVDEDQLSIFPATVTSGRYVTNDDVDSYANVAVLGSQTAQDLFGDQDPVGERITVKNVSLRIIGVLAPQGSRFFSNLDTRVYAPITMVQRQIAGVDYVNFITVKVAGDLETAKEDIRFIMRDAHRLDNPSGDLAKDDFNLSTQGDAVATISTVGFALTLLLAAIAAISLVVGGIGIMNIMLVSVTERTREIGLRKAIGATEKDILNQFLAEAIMLTIGGGILGVVIGVGSSLIIGEILTRVVDGWAVVIPPSAVFLAFAVSSIVGLVFGIYPARRAAKLDPIEALRYE